MKSFSSTNTKSLDSNREKRSIRLYQYGNTSIEYTLVKSKRRKTSEVIVQKNNGITLRVPFEKTMEEIEKILSNKIQWAVTKQREYKAEVKEIAKPTYENNSLVPYLGRNYVLAISYNDDSSEKKEKIEFMADKFIAYITRRLHDNKDDKVIDNQRNRLRKLYNTWLQHQANQLFVNRVNQFKHLTNAHPKIIMVKNLKNRWGSLTKDNSLHFNFNLIKAPQDVIDYVVIHELCHFKIKGHSYRFWDYLKLYVPDYEKNTSWLERNTDSLMN